MHLGGEVTVGPTAQDRGDQRGQVGRAERAEFQAYHVVQAFQHLLGGRVRRGQVRPERGDDRDRRVREAPQHDRQQGERVVVELVQVVHHHGDGPRRRERREQPRDRRAGAAEGGSRRFHGIGRQVQGGEGLAAHALGEARIGGEDAQRPAERGVGHPALQAVGAHGEDAPALAGQPFAGLGEQPGLADAGLARDHDGGQARGGDLPDRVQQGHQLAVPADERRAGAEGGRLGHAPPPAAGRERGSEATESNGRPQDG